MLKFVNAVVTNDLIESAVFVVAFSSNFTLDVNSIDVVSGVTIIGVTLARLYFCKLSVISFLAVSVRVEPDLGTIPI